MTFIDDEVSTLREAHAPPPTFMKEQMHVYHEIKMYVYHEIKMYVCHEMKMYVYHERKLKEKIMLIMKENWKKNVGLWKKTKKNIGLSWKKNVGLL